LSSTIRPRGRPRDVTTDERILKAALKHLTEDGLDGMSMAAVAKTANVTKPTIYLRWPSKEDLAVAAVTSIVADPTPPPADPTDAWEMLAAEIHQFYERIRRPNGMSLLGMLVAESVRRPELLELYRAQIVEVRRGRIRSAILVGQRLGSMRASADADEVVRLIIGHYYASYVAGAPLDADWPSRIVELLSPLLA
jgi:AcrR family transcriptional regulator